jgi:hypothetical protein
MLLSVTKYNSITWTISGQASYDAIIKEMTWLAYINGNQRIL